PDAGGRHAHPRRAARAGRAGAAPGAAAVRLGRVGGPAGAGLVGMRGRTGRGGEGSLMNVVHLTASTFFGGGERQTLGLARGMAQDTRSVFLSFAEGGRCRPFLGALRRAGFEGVQLENDTPRLWAASREVRARLERLRADVLLCHGYKANLLGR